MPPESLLATGRGAREQERWPVEVELLAQLIEETSIAAAGLRRRRPREIPRPRHLRRSGPHPGGSTGGAGDGDGDGADPYRRGVAVLAATSKRVHTD